MYISVEVSVKFDQEVDLKKMQVSIKKKKLELFVIGFCLNISATINM